MKRVKLSERDGWQSGKYETFIDDLARDDCPVPEPRRSLGLLELHFLLRDPPNPLGLALHHPDALDRRRLHTLDQLRQHPDDGPLASAPATRREPARPPQPALLTYFTLAHRRSAREPLPETWSDLVDRAHTQVEQSGMGDFEQYTELLGINAMSLTMCNNDGSPMPYETSAVNALGTAGGMMCGQMTELMRELGIDHFDGFEGRSGASAFLDF
ncbi:hypothetical protein JCM10296v2_001515 [Rhodotorula toruloides]